mgnify:CR=1 FL=1
MEDDLQNRTEELERKVNSMKEQILRVTRLIDQDNQEKNNLIQQSDQEMIECEERINQIYQEEKQVNYLIFFKFEIIKKVIDDRYLEYENRIKVYLNDAYDNRDEMKMKLNLIKETIEVK